MRQYPHNQFATCLLGDPVKHSVSDVMFQYFAKLTGIENYGHLKFKISKANSENLKIAMRAMAVFGIAGANITFPYNDSLINKHHFDNIGKATIRKINFLTRCLIRLKPSFLN